MVSSCAVVRIPTTFESPMTATFMSWPRVRMERDREMMKEGTSTAKEASAQVRTVMVRMAITTDTHEGTDCMDGRDHETCC